MLAVDGGASALLQVASLSLEPLWSKMPWVSLHGGRVLEAEAENYKASYGLGCKIPLLHSLGQNKSEGQFRFKGWGNRPHLSMGETESHIAKGCRDTRRHNSLDAILKNSLHVGSSNGWNGVSKMRVRGNRSTKSGVFCQPQVWPPVSKHP